MKRRASRRSFAGTVLALAIAFVVGACAEATPNLPDGLEITRADVRDISPPLSELAKMSLSNPSASAERIREANPPKRLTKPRPPVLDPVVQQDIGIAAIPAPIANFEGLGTGLPGYLVQSAPPDTIGDIGPDHYFQIVNFSLAIFDREGTIVLGPVPTRNLWAGFGGACAETNEGDATVRYDREGKRWIVGQFSVNGGRGPFYQCVAVSSSGDPLGTWHRYQYEYAAFNDYPKLALWPNAYFFTFNIFQDNVFSGSKVCAMDREKMMEGGDATMHCFNTGPEYGGLLASDLDGEMQPPDDAPNYLVAYGVNELQVWRMHADFRVPANDTFTGPLLLPVAPFTPLCDTASCVRQPDTTQPLDSLGDRLMNRLVYRRFPTHESLLVSHAVVAGQSGGVRWYELRSPERPTVHQQGTYAPDSAYRFMSSIAMDGVGNIALGYAISGSTISPGIRYTGRLVSDPPGTMGQGEATLVAGFGAQIGGLSRYGDYSSMNIDPVDDCTFWYTQEYIGATGSFNWRSRVGSFKFSTCGEPGDDFTLSVTPQFAVLTPGGSATLTVETQVLSGGAQTIALTTTRIPDGVTARFTPPSVSAGQSSQLTLSAQPGTPPSTTQVIVTGQTARVTHTAGIALTVLEPFAAGAKPIRDSARDGQLIRSSAPRPASELPRAIPDNNALGVVSTLELPGDAGAQLARLALDLEIEHGHRGDLVVTLTSPGGVQHVISRRAGGKEQDLKLERVELPAFVGQPAAGTWRLWVQDRASSDAGRLVSWALHPVTAPARTPSWSAEETPDAPIIDHGKLCRTVSVAAGADGGGAAAPGSAANVKLELVAQHDFGAGLKATLTHERVVNGMVEKKTVDAFPTATFSPGRGVWRLRARAIAGFEGAAAGKWTLCLSDSDGFGDTGVLRSWSVHD